MNKRKLRYVLAAVLLTPILAYNVSEIALRCTYHPPADPFPFPLAPLTTGSIVVSKPIPGLASQRTTYSVNSLGIRGDELNLQETKDVFKIMVLGGSVTECLLVDDAYAWPHVVQDVLQTNSSRSVWVGNAGRSGQNTLDYMAHMRVLVPAISPDLVIVMPGGNDLQAALEDRLLPIDLREFDQLARYMKKLYNPGYRKRFERLEPSYTLAIWRLSQRPAYTRDYTDFYLRMKQRRRLAPKVDTIPDWEDHLEVYRSNLEQLVQAADLLPQTRLMLMTHPYLWKKQMTEEEQSALWAGYSCLNCTDAVFYSRQALSRGLDAFNDITLEVCRAHHLLCFDLESKVEKTLEYFYDDAHLKTRGSRHVGRLIGKFLWKRGVVK